MLAHRRLAALSALVCVLGFAVPPVQAADVVAGDLVISVPFTRATPPGASVAGGYFTVVNKGSAPERLVGLTADISPRAEVHEMKMDKGMMTMRPVEGGLAIPPGGKLELKPGGYHVMFMGITRQLKAGETVKMVLTFEKAGQVAVEVPVEAIGAKGPSAGEHSH